MPPQKITFQIDADSAKALQAMVNVVNKYEDMGEAAKRAGRKSKDAAEENQGALGGLIGKIDMVSVATGALAAAGAVAFKSIQDDIIAANEAAERFRQTLASAQGASPGVASSAAIEQAVGSSPPSFANPIPISQQAALLSQVRPFNPDLSPAQASQIANAAGAFSSSFNPQQLGDFAQTLGVIQSIPEAFGDLSARDQNDLAFRLVQQGATLSGEFAKEAKKAAALGLSGEAFTTLASGIARTGLTGETMSTITGKILDLNKAASQAGAGSIRFNPATGGVERDASAAPLRIPGDSLNDQVLNLLDAPELIEQIFTGQDAGRLATIRRNGLGILDDVRARDFESEELAALAAPGMERRRLARMSMLEQANLEFVEQPRGLSGLAREARVARNRADLGPTLGSAANLVEDVINPIAPALAGLSGPQGAVAQARMLGSSMGAEATAMDSRAQEAIARRLEELGAVMQSVDSTLQRIESKSGSLGGGI